MENVNVFIVLALCGVGFGGFAVGIMTVLGLAAYTAMKGKRG